MAYDLTILEEGCRELGITLDEIQKKQFTDFYEYLVEKNKVMNLTGITEFQEVLVKHFLDSLACVKAVDMSRIKRIMDIGTGAGFPGVPLKIAFPHLEACLLDSLKKRVNFLEETFQMLKLENICEERKMSKILLDVRESNTAARSFYEEEGFVEEGIRQNFYDAPKEDAVLMSRKLGR